MSLHLVFPGNPFKDYFPQSFSSYFHKFIMAGLVPAILFWCHREKDTRDKPGHDEVWGVGS